MRRALNILSIDVEELYHAEYVRSTVSGRGLEARARVGIEEALRLLEKHGRKATFFFVGEVAERWPDILIELEELGHEIGFHGYSHRPLWEMGPDEFRRELAAFRNILGHACKGFRAPSFSLDMRTSWALRILAENGYSYDSSIFPIRTPLYGLSGAPIKPYRPSLSDPRAEDTNGPLLEFPIAVFKMGPVKLPIGGGFYLRLTPVEAILATIRSLNKKGIPAVIFVHSWELDPQTPIIPLDDP
ncbi:MAG: polysaccharide deacetylase, partial [Thermoprotei archaeon]